MHRLISDHDLFDDAILQGSNSADGWMSVVVTLIDVEVSLASLDLEISHVPSCFGALIWFLPFLPYYA